MNDGILNEEVVATTMLFGDLPESEFETTQLGWKECCWVPRLDSTPRFGG